MPRFAPTTENLNQLYRDNHDTAMVWKFYTGMFQTERYAMIDWRMGNVYIVNPDWTVKKQKLIVSPDGKNFFVRWGINVTLYPMTESRWDFSIRENPECDIHRSNLFVVAEHIRNMRGNLLDVHPDTNEVYVWPRPADNAPQGEEDEDVSPPVSDDSDDDDASTDPEVC